MDGFEDQEECDYDVYGDTRNRKGKIDEGYTKHGKSFKEQKRIYYAKEKRQMQREEDLKKNAEDLMEEEEVKSNKRKLKEIDENDAEYGNNYSPPSQKNNRKKKQPKKDRIRFWILGNTKKNFINMYKFYIYITS